MEPIERICETFLQECEDHLAALEIGLLTIQNGARDRETVDSVFRAVHCVKGGAGAFGCHNLVRFADVFETALDALRSGRLCPNPDVLSTMLRSADVLAELVCGARGGGEPDGARVAAAASDLAALTPPHAPQAATRRAFQHAADDFGFEPTPAVLEPGVRSDPSPLDVMALIREFQCAPDPAPPPPPAASAAIRKAVQQGPRATIRVDLDRVDRLIGLVGELASHGQKLIQRSTEAGFGRSSPVGVGLDALQSLTRELQDSVIAIRAQPVKSVFARMPRLAREVAALTGKQVRLVCEGEALEVDRTVTEHLADPLTHMIRNAVDHGLEPPDRRREAGKPEQGTVRLAAMHRRGCLVIKLSDDGAGIDRARVRASAAAKGLVAPETAMSDEEIDSLIFLPGVTAAASVTHISGRGVGMDVVRRWVQALGGRVAVTSRTGKGSTFTLSLPLTPAVPDGKAGFGETRSASGMAYA